MKPRPVIRISEALLFFDRSSQQARGRALPRCTMVRHVSELAVNGEPSLHADSRLQQATFVHDCVSSLGHFARPWREPLSDVLAGLLDSSMGELAAHAKTHAPASIKPAALAYAQGTASYLPRSPG